MIKIRRLGRIGKSIDPIGLFKVLRQSLFACPVARIIIFLKYLFLSILETSFLDSIDIYWQEMFSIVFLYYCIAFRLDFLLVREKSLLLPNPACKLFI
jgi:hypothetical protein